METPLQTLDRLVNEEISLAKTHGKTLATHEAYALVNNRHPTLYAAARASVTPLDISAAEQPVIKSGTSGHYMLMLAQAKVLKGESPTLDDALQAINRDHPDLYTQHRQGL